MTTVLPRWDPPAGHRVGPLPVLERNLLVYRRLWLVVLSGFFEPVFYLTAVGYGMGPLVGVPLTVDGHRVSFAAFVAPAMLAASVMNGALFDSTLNFFYKLRYSGVYHGMLATSLSTGSVMLGEVAWALVRGALYGCGFLVVTAALGLASSPWTLLTLPALLLIGAAFAALGMAATTFVRTWQDTTYFHLAILPMFLLSATFYPVSVLPGWAQVAVHVSPLYHAVALLRGLMLGALSPALIAHAAVLLVATVAGGWLCVRRFSAVQAS
jgi:lipooligosaccharide transport system permease protein